MVDHFTMKCLIHSANQTAPRQIHRNPKEEILKEADPQLSESADGGVTAIYR
jgi:hypothetical protein